MKNKQRYIIRGDRSGVFFGEIAARNGQEVTIRNCRRLWFWSGANSLSQLAVDGVRNPGACRFTVTVGELVVLDVIELIPCTEKACKSIDEVHEWRI